MENYKVRAEDIKGDIGSFPIEVVQKMVDYQVEQVGNADVSVFQRNYNAADDEKGFDWAKTQDGLVFWDEVINKENFDLFFEKYPKENNKVKKENTIDNNNESIEQHDSLFKDVPKLLYSYEDYKKGYSGHRDIEEITDRINRMLILSCNFNKTKEQEEEFNKLRDEVDLDNKNQKFTTLTHEITDLYFELKNIHDDELRYEKYELIGRKQCEIEIIKEEFNNK
jgi:hypothetical protein